MRNEFVKIQGGYTIQPPPNFTQGGGNGVPPSPLKPPIFHTQLK